jgi:hypothetical protein
MYARKESRMSVKRVALPFLLLGLLALPVRAADVDKLLPNNSSVVVFVDVRQILDSALVKKHGQAPLEKALKNNGNIDKLLTSAGFDPLKDINSITLALEGDLSKANGLLIVRGKFNVASIAARAEELARKDDRLKIESIAGQSVYRTKGPDGEGYLAVLNESTAIASPDKSSIESALARHSGKDRLDISKELKQHIEAIEVGRSVWLVANGVALRKVPLAADDKVKEVLDRIQFVTLTVAVSDGVAVKTVVAANNGHDAKALNKDIEGGLESAKGVIAVLADGRPELAPIGEVLDTLKLKTEGTTLRLDLTASASVIEKILKTRK